MTRVSQRIQSAGLTAVHLATTFAVAAAATLSLGSSAIAQATIPSPGGAPIVRVKTNSPVPGLTRPAPADAAAETVAAAGSALQRGQSAEAVKLASQALATDPANFRALAIRGRAHTLLKKPTEAIADYTAALKLDPSSARLYQARGEDSFRLGRFKESVADFDRYLEFVPAEKPHHWQRGISCYYAGLFEEGRRQFEIHQTVNAHDVENAVWHFLCHARTAGVEKARAALIPIEGDRRVPMSQVHALFAGKLKPEDVLAAARDGQVSEAERNNRLFFAHLYLGLYFEAMGQPTPAREHIFKAAADTGADHYMGDVARSHAAVLRARPAP